MNAILAENDTPEERFQKAFLYATGVLANSTNTELSACVRRLEDFWRKDLAETAFVTAPEGYEVMLVPKPGTPLPEVPDAGNA